MDVVREREDQFDEVAEPDLILRVLLADEQALFREVVRMALQSQPDIRVVAEAADGVQAVAEAERTGPDVAVLDAELPNCDGIRATALIRERVPDCRVLLISRDQSDWILAKGLEAGATGYLTKESRLAELIDATRAIRRGETLIPQNMLQPLLGRLIRGHKERDEALRRIARLSRREREVLALLGEGADNSSIAGRLVISPETARTHIQNLIAKLGLHSRLEAAAFVRSNGIREELTERGAL